MQDPQPGQAQHRVPLVPHGVEALHQVVARGVEMAGIGAERDPRSDGRGDRLPQRGQFVEPRAQRRAGTGGGLDQDRGTRDGLEGFGVRMRVPPEPGAPSGHEVPRVGDDPGNPQEDTALELGDEAGDGPEAQGAVG